MRCNAAWHRINKIQTTLSLILLNLLKFHPFFTVFITFLLLPSLNIPSLNIPVRARLKKWNNGLMVKTMGFQSRGSSWGAPRSSQPIIFLRVKFLLFVWVATYKVRVTTLYIDSLMPNFVYWCLALSTLNLLNCKRWNRFYFLYWPDLALQISLNNNCSV